MESWLLAQQAQLIAIQAMIAANQASEKQIYDEAAFRTLAQEAISISNMILINR